MTEVTEVIENDDLYVKALDNVGREFTFRFEEENDGEEHRMYRVYLPEDCEWNVAVFQELVDVRDEVVGHFGNLYYEPHEGAFELSQVRYHHQNPLQQDDE